MNKKKNPNDQESLDLNLTDEYKAMMDKMLKEENNKIRYVSAEVIKAKYFK